MNFNKSRVVSLVLAGILAIVLGSVFLKRKNGLQNPGQVASADLGAGNARSNERGLPAGTPTKPAQSADDLTGKAPAVFGLNGTVQLNDVPQGRFHEELARLDNQTRRVALDKLGTLQVPFNDVASLSVDREGRLYYRCTPPRPPLNPVVSLSTQNQASPESNVFGTPVISAASVPIATPPVRHSRPGASKVIYLDFNGHTIAGTNWNLQQGNSGDEDYHPAVASYVAKPFSIDSDPATFNDTEQGVIIRIWERVAEDFKPFDVDVTTEEPATFTNNTGRILITDNVDANNVNMPSSTASGVAYLDVFGSITYSSKFSPALVYANQNYNNEGYIAETASHEIGHNLSLSHDGTTTGDEYYQGHGSGETSWNTLMGSAYSENVTQWSKGGYYNANNTQDDLALISGHFGYVPDDYADSNASATALTLSGAAVSGAGVISQTGEADRFSFASGPGSISITVSPYRSNAYTYGGNLDVGLELYDSGGSRLTTASPEGATAATLSTNVNGGTYYLRVYGSAAGNPMVNPPTGYTSYGSLGQYTIAGTVVSTNPVAPGFSVQPVDQTVVAGQTAQFSATVSAYPAATFQWQRSPVGGGGWVNLVDGGIFAGATTSQFTITATQLAMNGDQFRCVATNTVNAVTSNAARLVVNPVVSPSISGLPATLVINYGDSLNLVPTVTGTQPITYQWKKGGVAIPGATSSAFSKSYATTADSGIYALSATNAGDTVTGSNVNVTVNAPVAPSIVSQPVSLSVVIGSSATFSVSVGGTNPLAYQWYFNSQAISGASSSSLLVASAQASNAGSYTVVVTGPGGSKSSNPATLTVRPLTGVIAAFTSSFSSQPSSLFLKCDGSLWGMGANNAGQLGDGTTSMRPLPFQMATNAVSAAVGQSHSLVVKSDLSLWAIGMNSDGQLGDGTAFSRATPIYIAGNVVAASAGGAHSLFIKSDGTLWGMGSNASGQLGDGNPNRHFSPVLIATDVIAAAATQDYSLYITSDGTLWGMGADGSGQMGNGSSGAVSPIQIAVGIRAASAGFVHSFFVKSDNTLWGIGANDYGQMGDGSTASHPNPAQITGGVAAASAGAHASLLLKLDSTLWAMGANWYGQLGDGTFYNRVSPVQIASGVASISAGAGYGLFCKSNGTLMAMGNNYYGQLGSGVYSSDNTTPIQIAAGALFIPDAPSGINATDGTAKQGVRMTWTPVIGATRYEVWRSATNNAGTAVLIAGNVSSALAYDLTATAGLKYYYWVKAANPAGASAFSSSDSGFSRGQSADFNQDGQADILWQNVGSGDHGIWIMNGTVPSAWINLPVIALAWQIVGTGDFNGDGQTDILWENVGSGDRGLWIMNGTVPAAWINLPSIALNWRIVGAGDFNGDGQTDILWENISSGDRGMWIMNGTVPAAWINLPSIALNWRIVGTGDFNGDGETDILWENVGSGDRGMWIMNGTVPAAWINLPSIALNWRIVGTGDFNGDGETDILWENVGSGDRGIWIMNATVPAAWINLPTLSLDWRIAL